MGEALIYGLSALWSLGCIGLSVWSIVWTLRENEWVMAAVAGFIGLPIAALLAIMPWAFIAQTQSPNLAVLKKNEWVCTETRTETTMMPVATGRTTTIVPTIHSVCIVYARTN